LIGEHVLPCFDHVLPSFKVDYGGEVCFKSFLFV
jgi:hypothetical protein